MYLYILYKNAKNLKNEKKFGCVCFEINLVKDKVVQFEREFGINIGFFLIYIKFMIWIILY